MKSQRPPTTDDMKIAVHLLHFVDTMDGAVAAHNVTADRGHGYLAGSMVWREMMGIINVPEWDLFMVEMVDRSGRHRQSIALHWLCNGSPCKESYLLRV